MKKILSIFLFSGLIIALFSCGNSGKSIERTVDNEELNKVFETYPENKTKRFELFNKIASEYGNAETYSKIAVLHYNKGDLETASYFFKKAAQIYLSDSLMIKYAEQLANLSVIYEILGLYPEAVENYHKALEIFKQNHDIVNTSKIYNNLGVLYQHLNQPDKALAVYKKSLSLIKDDSLLLASRYNNIATVYEESLNNYDSAIYYYTKAYVIYKDKNNNNLPVVENNLANVYLLNSNTEKAKLFIKKAVSDANRLDLKSYMSKIYRNQAKIFIAENKIDSAEKTLIESINLARKYKDKNTELEDTKILYDLSSKKHEYKKANEYLIKYYNLKEKLTGEKLQTKVAGLEVKSDLSEKDHKINLLLLSNKVKSQRLLTLWLFVVVLIFLLSALFLFFRLKQKQNKLNTLRMRRSIENYIREIEEVKVKNAELIKQKENEILNNVKKFGLTEREEKILLLIAKGYTNNEISEKLFVSVNTVKTHTKNIFLKLNVRNRTEAAKIAHNL